MTDADSGSGGGPGPPPDISSLKENFNQQQAKISALKELVRQSEANQGKNTASAQEKVKNIAQRLSHLKSKATKSRQGGRWNTSADENESILQDRSISEKPEGSTAQSDDVIPPTEITRARSETPGSEKIQLLRKQMEQNRLKMAERENSKRGIEELVTQLKAKVDSSKSSLEKTSQLGRSVGDLSVWSGRDRHMSSSDLSSYATTTIFEKERLKFLERRVRELEIEMKNKENEFLNRNADSEHLLNVKRLESRILDLEEALKEKECVIDARTQAVSLLSENLSLKGKNTVDLLEETKLEMQEMQKKFIEAENGYRVEIERLKSEIEEKNVKIENMDQVNDILETARFDLTVKNSELEEKFDGVQDFSNKLSELNKINHSLQQRIATLESEKKMEENLDELQATIEKLQIENDALKKMLQHSEDAADETDVSLLDKIKSLENVISSQSEDIDKHLATIERLEESLQEKTIEYNVLTANFSVLQEKVKSAGPKSLFSMSTDEEAEAEITKLKSQLDEANKSMIKTKLKAKQLQKQLDSVKKSSNSSADVIRLTEENQILQQQITEMKSSLAADGKSSSSPDTDLEKKVKILETTCQNQVSAIRLLEEQKIDMTVDLQTTKTELTTLKDHIKGTDDEEHTAMVTSHMDSIEMEEKIDQHLRQNDLLQAEIDRLMDEKQDLSSKLTAYMTENMELLEKLDKISKGSSAESIELIENLTHQEKLEMEEFQKGLHPIVDASEGDTSGMSADLSESLVKLREESSELMHKIEMFTSERREVLDRVEDLKAENLNLVHEVDVLKEEKEQILNDFDALQKELASVKERLMATEVERADLQDNVKDLSANRSKLQDELNSLIKCRNVTIDDVQQASFSSESSVEVMTNDDYEKALKGLEMELENFKKGKDKSVKSKKLAKEAKNVYELLKKLMNDYENSAKQVAELKAEIGRINLQQQEERIKLLLTDEVDKISENRSREELKLQRDELERVTAAMQDLQLNYEKLQVQLDEKDALLRSADDNSTETEMLTLRNENDRLKEKVAEIERTLHFDHETIEQKTQELIQLKLEFDNRVDTANKEIDILKKLTAEQKDQLIATLTEHETEISEKVAKIDELELKLVEMSREVEEAKNQFAASRDEYVEQLQGKVAALKTIFDENNDLLEEQANELRNKQETIESLNGQIMELYKVMEENANKVIEKEDEMNYLQELIDRNEQQSQTFKDKCAALDNTVRKLEAELQKKSKEIEALNQQQQQQSKVADGNQEIENLKKKHESTVAELESKNKEQLDKLKKFAANLKKKNAQCAELEQKLERMDRGTDEKHVEELKQKLENLQQLLFQKDQELNVMKHESSLVAAAVQQSSSAPDTDKVIEELRASNAEEISRLSADIAGLEDELRDAHNQIADLNRRYNSDVANKSAELDNLNARMNEKVCAMDELTVSVEKKTAEVAALQNSLKESNAQLTATADDLKSKNIKIEKCRAVIKEKNQTIQKLNASIAEYKTQLEEQQNEKSDSPKQCERLQEELTGYRETIASLQNELESMRAQSANVGAMEMKNEENQHYIESLLETNQKLSEKIAKLEEGIGNIEERRSSLERHANLLGSTLQEKTSEFQKNEDELLSRLQALSQHDETIEQRLHEADLEKQELGDRLSEVTEERNELVKKLQLIGSQMAQLQGTTLSDLEGENATLMEQVKTLEHDLKRQSSEFERKMDEQKSVIADLEYDLSAQLQRLTDERRDLQHNLEKSNDEINELNCDVVRFKEIITSLEQSNSDLENKMTWIKMQNESMNQEHIENQELRMQIVHDQTEIENLKEQTETLQQNHEREVAALRQQILEFDSLRAQIGQNQTDDQVFIQNENERLQGLLATKDAEIQNYQRQNLQLQMSLASAPTTNDPFNSLSQPSVPHIDSDELLILTRNVEDLQTKLQTAVAQVTALQEQNNQLHAQDSLKAEIIDTMNKAHDDQLHKLQSECAKRLTELEERNKELCDFSEKKESELKRLQSESEQRANVTKVDELQTNVQQLEQYIADLQIQLRISTNDCEQTAQTIQSLEQEIQLRTAKYEAEIASLRGELERLTAQQPPVQEAIAQKSVASTTAAEPQQFLTDIERMIIPAVPPTNQPSSFDQPTGLPSFNSSMFFGSTQPTAFDDAFPSSHPDSLPVEEENRTPVVEEVCVAKKAYLCHPDPVASESEPIVSTENRAPVVEEVCVAKKAYLCHPEEVSMTDDGWGFGSDDAVLEEQHQQMTGSMATSSLVPAHIGQTLQDYEDAIKLLQAERDQLQEEKVALQIQSAKMLKKLKEYKSKNEQLSTAASFQKSPSVESNDLDLAIQEELNNQIKLLETRCKEMKAEQDKESSEKQNLQKRIDVLTAANDTMVDLKQRQDNELEMCKTKIRQLSQKISQLEEWSDDNYNKTADESSAPSQPGQPTTSDENAIKQIELLTKQLSDARADFDEIQALLDDEKSHSSILEDRIKKLQESLLARENEAAAHAEVTVRIDKLSAENTFLQNDNTSKSETIAQLKGQIAESIATIDVLTQEANNIKTYLDQLKEEHRHKIDENNNLSKELSLLSDKNVELSAEVERMKTAGVFGDQTPSNSLELKAMDDRIHELTAVIQYKDAEIGHLNQKVADVIKEDQTQSLVQEILNKNFEINNLRSQVDQLQTAKDDLENNLSLQLTKEIQNQNTADTAERVGQLEKIIAEMKTEKSEMEHELQVLNDQVLNSLQLEDKVKATVLELDMKTIEISELKNSLEQMKHNSVEMQPNTTVSEDAIASLNAQWEQVMEQRCSDLAESWRHHVSQREAEFSLTEATLRQEIDLLRQALRQSNSSSEAIETIDYNVDAHIPTDQQSDNELIGKMQAALENQEMEIVTLKEQLAIRSAEYARIVSQVDPFGQMSRTSSMMTMDLKAKKSTETLESTAGQKSELDLALYMLHQRDMRCEELTEELIHLLEERDTLQLKLSNSIRQIEDIRQKTGYVEAVPSENESANVSPEKPPSNRSSVSLSSEATEAQANSVNLNAKLSQLHNVSHSRDKTLREEREQRQRQMALLQRDVATLPPEAVAELIGADYTLSRQSQSPSSVLLNWLWGKSTPRPPDTN